ncbi:histone-lysine n-methyltransferase setd3 [Phtheirospermum japonicum]|uniref:Histone-lysine n-methyltransferase setd3 n=1 Tax=Phtheirospermum japonicum TaxID=374723 RepID=A0A830C6Y9_9LAMI|nr:histone-lysine n-methyltransferase setd3 [Phtheirospermum japonicum]
MHTTIFWSDEELEMIRPSALYDETFQQKAQIEKDFLLVKSALDWEDAMLREFVYVYGLVTSRVWESSKGVSMIPFADFLNHDGNSESYVLSDESKCQSEVIADRDFGPGNEVLIMYGEFSNSTLLLDFGFIVSRNRYDRVRVGLNVPKHDGLYEQKVELLDRHRTPSVKDVNEFFSSSGNLFTIRNVKNGTKNGKGIPQSARAFCRVLICDSMREINDLAIEAEGSDGRLAQFPLKDGKREIEAHRYLLSENISVD